MAPNNISVAFDKYTSSEDNLLDTCSLTEHAFFCKTLQNMLHLNQHAQRKLYLAFL